jgi:hypothetical protein
MELQIFNRRMDSQTSEKKDYINPRSVPSNGSIDSSSEDKDPLLKFETHDEKNPEYNPFRAWAYPMIHAIGTIYFGYAIAVMNNLAKPVLQHNLRFYGEDFSNLLANQNAAFGIGKVISSIIAGASTNKFGRRN